MATPGQTLENPITGERITFRTTTQNSDGRSWEAELFIPPYRGKVSSAHFHPTFAETFEVLSGTACYSVDGGEAEAKAGEVIIVPAGKAHIHPWSASDESLHLRQRLQLDRPDFATLRKIEFFAEAIFGLAQSGQVDKEGMPRPLYFAQIAKEMQPIGYLAGMPIPAQHLLFGALAALGRLLGYRIDLKELAQAT
jgi:mannose-6-phosphate isomerase-like protein (cupin superfamily)